MGIKPGTIEKDVIDDTGDFFIDEKDNLIGRYEEWVGLRDIKQPGDGI